jgi:DnaJ-class molecular chaperone
MAKEDYYDLLGVSRDVSDADLKKTTRQPKKNSKRSLMPTRC